MNYSNPNLLRPLAERFVLGTMTRRGRRRFSRLIDEDNEVAASVYDLEATLLPLAWSLEPIVPSALVWRRISRIISKPDTGRSRWPAIAAAASLAFVVATIGWWQAVIQPPKTVIETVVETVPSEPAIGVISGEDGGTLWVARIYPDLQRADVTVSNTPEQHAQKDYELWILRDDGVPVSLGLLPQAGERSLTLAATAVDALARGSTLAVSLEPLGGSPAATPTGPVLYTTALLAP